MPVPKSVVKFKKKNGNVNVEFTSSVDYVNYTMKELCRAGLRDVGKFAKKQFASDFYSKIKKRTGQGGKAKGIGFKVYSSKNTLYPRVDIYINTKNNRQYLAFQETGSSRTPKYGILTSAVQNNVDTIIQIESQYLTGLNSENPSVPIGEGDLTEEE